MKKIGKGWVEGEVEDFLNLSLADVEYIETRMALSRLLREERRKKKMTQGEMAEKLHTSQSRVAKMERCDPSVSVDLLLRSLFGFGIKRKDLGFLTTSRG